MSDVLYAIFLADLILLFYLLFKYLKALDGVLCAAPSSLAAEGSRGPSKLSLLSDYRFALSLYTRSYRKNFKDSPAFVEAMDTARKYLVWQYPLAFIAFILPILSKAA